MIDIICMYHGVHIMKLKGVMVPYKSKRDLKRQAIINISMTACQVV